MNKLEQLKKEDIEEVARDIRELYNRLWNSEDKDKEAYLASKSVIKTLVARAYSLGANDAVEKLSSVILPKAKKFIDKVESGRARSKETYADMKEIVALLESAKQEK